MRTVATVALALALTLGGAGRPAASPAAMDALNLGAPPRPWPAPEFTLPRLGGGTLSLKDLRGKVVLLNFWTTWCQPCRLEMPVLERFYRQHHARGFVVVGISVDAAGAPVGAFVQELDLTFPIVLDPGYEVADRYRVMGLPGTFIVGRDGLVKARGYGPREWDTPAARELLDTLLRVQ